MTYRVDPIYSTPVYYSIVNDWQSINYGISKVLDKVNFEIKEDWGKTHYISTDFSNKSSTILKDLGLNRLTKEIDSHIKQYCSELEFNVKEYVLSSWLTKFEKGNYAHIHNHAHADISGVYYYKTNGEDGEIFFEPPVPWFKTSICYEKWRRRWMYTPKEGKILLFPGWLEHGVKTNLTDNVRMSLSFNVCFKHLIYQ